MKIIIMLILALPFIASAHEEKKPEFCTMEYAPVCAEVKIKCDKEPCDKVTQTISNACVAKSRNAKILHKGICRSDKKEDKHDKKIKKEPPKFPFGKGPSKGNVVPGKNAPIPMDSVGEFDLSTDNVVSVPKSTNATMKTYGIGITLNLSDGQTIKGKKFQLKGNVDEKKWKVRGKYPGYVTILDVDGNKILRSKLKFARNGYHKEIESEIELKDVPSGAYIVKIENFDSKREDKDYKYVNIKVNIISEAHNGSDDLSKEKLDKIHNLIKGDIEKVEHKDNEIEVKTVRYVWLLGLFKIKLQESYILDKDFTKIIKHVKPWWSKLTI